MKRLVVLLMVLCTGCFFWDSQKEDIQNLAVVLDSQDFVQLANVSISGPVSQKELADMYEYYFSGLRFSFSKDSVKETNDGTKLFLNISNKYGVIDTELLMQKEDDTWKFDFPLMLQYNNLRNLILYTKAEEFANLLAVKDYEGLYPYLESHVSKTQFDYAFDRITIDLHPAEMAFMEGYALLPISVSNGKDKLDYKIQVRFNGIWLFDLGELLSDKNFTMLVARNKADDFISAFNSKDYEKLVLMLDRGNYNNLKNVFSNITLVYVNISNSVLMAKASDLYGNSVSVQIPITYDGAWKFYIPFQENIAEKKFGAVAGSEETLSRETERINDAKFNLLWSSNRKRCSNPKVNCTEYLLADPHRIFIDFGRKWEINSIRVFFSDKFPFNYQIQAYDEGWVTLVSINGNNYKTITNVFGPVNTSVIGLYVIESVDLNDLLEILEFEVYNLYSERHDDVTVLKHTLIEGSEEVMCYDTDGSDELTIGNFIYLKGECRDNDGKAFTDECIGESAVTEYGCTPSGTCKKLGWACPSGKCRDGICLK